MGEEIQKESFTATDYEQFQHCLERETEFLRGLFAESRFDNHSRRLGYELELCLADRQGNPSKHNTRVIETAANPLFTSELAKFNLELNGNPFAYQADVFDRIEQDLKDLFQQAENAAGKHNCDVAMFGVFPSVFLEHLDPNEYMTDLHRYRLLNSQVLDMRGRPVALELSGEEHLDITKQDVMLEALATSLQIHMQLPFDEMVPAYHAGLWSSMLILGASANSPVVLGHCCWAESRIGIFKQAVDTRNPQEMTDHIVPRVHLGKGYINSILDLFEDNFYYSPILPEVLDNPIEDLHHLCLHNGTIWRWVRPIVSAEGDGAYHLRLELRVVPSGPTLIDTLANTVFYVGLTEGLKSQGDQLTQVPFETLESDFYCSAREGLEARVHWIDGSQASNREILLQHAIPAARAGLKHNGIENTDHWLDIIEARVTSGKTGARWIDRHWKQHGDGAKLVCDYLKQARTNRPVHQWQDPDE